MTTKRAYFQSRRRAVAGLAAMLLGAVALIGGTGGGANAAHVEPEFIDGNKSCGELGYLNEFKINGVPANQAYAINVDGTNGFITISNSNGYTFDFSSTITVSAVFVKAADGGNLYVYDPPVAADTGLVSPPTNPGGPQARVSHVSFCFDEVEETTTTTSSTTTSSTTTSSTTSTSTTSTTLLPTTTTLFIDITTTTVPPTTTETVLGTTATTEEETTTTLAPTTAEEPTTSETVAGVQVSRQLPRTGSDSLPMTEAGLVLIMIGFGFMASSRLATSER